MKTPNELPNFPQDQNGPRFKAPWEAETFAMAVSLEQCGIFTWSEWAQILGDEIKRAQRAGDPDDGSTYYQHWTNALERILSEKDIVQPALLSHYHMVWKQAAERTPHGRPIELRPEDYVQAV
jgi:nitrile hydratase accessory protein